ncbi:MAG TPA: nucleotidyltransferase domain-containing protein [Rhizomicrobium sp.]
MTEHTATPVDLPAAPPGIAADPIMRRIKNELSTIYGARLTGVVLYGSRARRDNRPDSDIDIMALIRNFDKTRDLNEQLFRLSDSVFRESGLELNIFARDEGALGRRTIFMHNVRQDGVRI